MSKIFTAAEVASHNKSDSLYITVDGDVYDLTTFQDDHPGEFMPCAAVCQWCANALLTRQIQAARRSSSA